jgi:probable HAF family extracellular repeat protein
LLRLPLAWKGYALVDEDPSDMRISAVMNTKDLVITALYAISLNGAAHAEPIYYSVTPVAVAPSNVLLNNEGQYVTSAYSSAFLVNGSGPNAGQVAQISIPGATSINPTGLNDSGQVVGSYTTASGASYPFVYSNGQATELNTSPGFNAAGLGTVGYPEAANLVINDSGVIAGQTPVYVGTTLGSDLLIENKGVATNEGYPAPSIANPYNNFVVHVEGINNAGQVLVSAGTPIIFSNGAYTSIQTTSYTASAAAINNQGVVAGELNEAAAIYSNGTWKSLGTLGGTSSAAFALNDEGAAVGWSNTPGSDSIWHAFLYENGKMIDLNTLLPPSLKGITLFGATSINDLGQIVAFGGTSQNGPYQEYLLTPPGETPLVGVTSLPEPSTLAFFGLVAASLGLRRLACRARSGPHENDSATPRD